MCGTCVRRGGCCVRGSSTMVAFTSCILYRAASEVVVLEQGEGIKGLA